MDENLEVIIDIPRHRQEIVVRDQPPGFIQVGRRVKLDTEGNRFASSRVEGQ